MEDVKDGGQIKHNWLWTTLADTRQSYDFDSFRCFVWNVKRHRYETAHIEKNLRGYYPVEAHPVKMMAGKREESSPGFSLIVEDEDGVRWRKLYGFHTYHVVLLRKERWAPAPSRHPVRSAPLRRPRLRHLCSPGCWPGWPGGGGSCSASSRPPKKSLGKLKLTPRGTAHVGHALACPGVSTFVGQAMACGGLAGRSPGTGPRILLRSCGE